MTHKPLAVKCRQTRQKFLGLFELGRKSSGQSRDRNALRFDSLRQKCLGRDVPYLTDHFSSLLEILIIILLKVDFANTMKIIDLGSGLKLLS